MHVIKNQLFFIFASMHGIHGFWKNWNYNNAYEYFCICALAHNALQLPFFFFFSFSTGFWMNCLKLFKKCCMINYQGSMWPRSNSLSGHTKSFSVKSVPQVVIHDACCTWHGLNTVTRIDSIQKKHKKNSQTPETS